MARSYKCDVPGYTRTRLRWQRICDTCFAALPGDIRTGIMEHFRGRRYRQHRQECRRAKEFLARRAERQSHHHPSPEQCFANSERLLGER